MRRAAIVLALAAAAAASCGRVPPPRVPQAEQASQAVHRGGERYRAHQRCGATTRNVEALIRCMDVEGYHFVPSAPDEPAAQCWQLRDAAEDGALPPPYCFVHAADAPH